MVETKKKTAKKSTAKKATAKKSTVKKSTAKKKATKKKTPVKKRSAIDMAIAHAAKQKHKSTAFASRVELDFDNIHATKPHIPTGSVMIDYGIGGRPNIHGIPPCPGLPRGKLVQVYGLEACGKTTFALESAATTCAIGGSVVYIDWEHEVDAGYAADLGVPVEDPSRFSLYQPDDLEAGLELIWRFARAGVDLILIDSVGSAVPSAELDKKEDEIGKAGQVGKMARVWSDFLRKLKALCNKTGTCIMGISQLRAKINTNNPKAQGDPWTVQGGNAWRYYASLRMRFTRVKKEVSMVHDPLTNRQLKRVYGDVIKCRFDKCKVSSSQFGEVEFYIRYGEGIDDYRSIIEIAAGHKVIQRTSKTWFAWTSMDGTAVKRNGIDQTRRWFKENPLEFDALYEKVKPFIMTVDMPEDDDDEMDEFADGDDELDIGDLVAKA